MAGKTKTVRLGNTLIDKDGNVAIIDSTTNSQVIIGIGHYKIHSGNHYFISDVVTLAVNHVFDIQITVPADTYPHFLFKLDSESETEWYLYEDVAIVTSGTAITPRNNNRNSLNTSSLVISGIENDVLVDANADTDISGATELETGLLGAGKNSGVDSNSDEIILSAEKIYTIRIIATAAGYIDYKLKWYE